MKKLLCMVAVLTLMSPLAHSITWEPVIRGSLIDFETRYEVGMCPASEAFRFTIDALTIAGPLFIGTTLYEASFDPSGYVSSSFIPLRIEVPIILFPGFLYNPGQFGFLLGIEWSWLAFPRDDRHLALRLEFDSPMGGGVFVETSWYYWQSATYPLNLFLGIRVGAQIFGSRESVGDHTF
jgi:hypothetical protein